MQLEFEIDKLTNSIEDAATGVVLPTATVPFEKADLNHVTVYSNTSDYELNHAILS